MLKELNQLMDYIEHHLEEEITETAIARIVCMPASTFKRIFTTMTNMTLSHYIRNRKLAKANEALIAGKSVTEVAFLYGYESVAGFSRAYKAFIGKSPSEAVKDGQQISFPKLVFYMDVRGGTTMEFKIEKKEAFRIVGVAKRVPIQFEGVNTAISQLAQSITKEQREHMHELNNYISDKPLNVSWHHDEAFLVDGGEVTHMIGMATTKENPYESLDMLEFDAHTWAVFPNQGPFPETLQETYGKIASEWLPAADYVQVADVPVFSHTDYSDLSNAYSEIWMAVEKK